MVINAVKLKMRMIIRNDSDENGLILAPVEDYNCHKFFNEDDAHCALHNARRLGQLLDGRLVIIVILALGMIEENNGGNKS